MKKSLKQASLLFEFRTLTQEDPGDSQASIEEITQMVGVRKLFESARLLLL